MENEPLKIEELRRELNLIEETLSDLSRRYPPTPETDTPNSSSSSTLKIQKKVKESNNFPFIFKVFRKKKFENRIDEKKNYESKKDKKGRAIQLLTQEVHRLRRESDSVERMKKQMLEVEEKHTLEIEDLESAVEKNNELIGYYEQTIYGHTKVEKYKNPSEIIKTLSQTTDKLENEKQELKNILKVVKKNFAKNLKEEAEKIEKAWRQKSRTKERSRRRLKKKGSGSLGATNTPGWLITYLDVFIILVTFFVLYYSIAAMNMERFKEAILGTENASIGILDLLNSSDLQDAVQKLMGTNSDFMLAELKEASGDSPIDILGDNSKVTVRVPGRNLFDPGEASLKSSMNPYLDEVIRISKKYPDYMIHIKGHTDDELISTEKFPTNWELSASRATAVLRYFIDKGIEPIKLTATGFADTFPLRSNDTVVGRAVNRRVELVLEQQ